MAWQSQVSVNTSATADAGWCLWLAEEAVGAPHLYPSAREAANNCDLHADRDYPTDAVVALFWDWTSKSDGVNYGHVVINVPGQGLFSSPKNWGVHGSDWYGSIDEVSNWLGATYLGWAPDLAGLQLSVWAGDAAPTPAASNQRVAGAIGVFRRAEPNQASDHLDGDLEAGVVGTFIGWIHGENRDGNDVWFQGVSGDWFWSGAFTSTSTDSLTDLNPVAPAPVIEPAPAIVPVEPPVVIPPVAVEPPAPPIEPPIVKDPTMPEIVTPPVNQNLTLEEIALQKEQIAALPAADLGAIIQSVKARKIAYSVYAALSLIVTNAAIGFASLGQSFPAWLIVSIAITGSLSLPFAALAVANAKTPAA